MTDQHRWVSTADPEDDSPWCANCGIPIEYGFGKPCRAVTHPVDQPKESTA